MVIFIYTSSGEIISVVLTSLKLNTPLFGKPERSWRRKAKSTSGAALTDERNPDG
jgi:hypothetical protein